MTGRTKQMGSEKIVEVDSQGPSVATRKTWPKVAIIVLNWNGWRDTIKCLESLLKFQYPKYDVIVIDNGSSDNSVGSIQGWLYNKLKIDVPVIDCTSVLSGRSLEDLNEHFIIIQNKENLGVGAGYNVGLGYAARKNYKWVFLLDQDSIPQADVLQSLLSFAEATSEKVGILCCVRVDKDTGIVYRPIRWTGNRWRKLLTSDSEIAKTPILIGAAGFSGMFLNVSILNEVGYPRQDYFIDYDDYEFCLRVRAHSLPIYYVPAAKIKHSVGQLSVATFWGKTFLSSNHPPYRYYYQARNRLYTHWYAHRNFAASMWALLSVLKLLARVAFFERKTIKKTYFILRGVVDGLHGKMGKQIETGNG